ncbi:SAM-dependent methyltransferase [Plantactinospora endophytica]|uniref:Methyltransferase type 11 n=1 Tax=Plantactinospora endophytica TaxID=673535 RepID=A0ABQ4E6K3_9ACTN|nr:methyltransferase domain-containing protein [Plantactinospora endophytica]GIG90354.1 methyltransferase type 11 [Plantactinospora endophytica]
MSVDYKVPTPEAVGAFYDQVNAIVAKVQGGAMHYGYWTGPDDDSDFETASDRFTDMMIERIDARPGQRVLDVGCGPGRPGVRLAKSSGAELVGISVSEQDVRLANERARAEGVSDRVRFEQANMLALPFPDNSFDHAMAFESIVHVQDRVAALREIARVVRPGGRIALTDFTVREGPEGGADQTVVNVYDSWHSAAPVKAEEYEAFVPQAGLVLDEITDITDNVKYTGMWTYLELRRYARENPVPPEVDKILGVFGPLLNGTEGAPGLTDEQLVQGWRRLLTKEQVQGMIIVVAHLPAD